MRFKDKVVIITGGSAGMGKAAAVGFAREGAKVVINARHEGRLQETAGEIRAAGGIVTIACGDVTQKETAHAVVSRTLEQYGRVDILFNYVGGIPDGTTFGPFMPQTEEYWDQVIELNLKQTMRFCHEVLDGMIKQKYGKIINTAALAGRIGSANMVLYSAVKGGIIAFTKALAQEYASYNINVNCVSPGAVDTPGSRIIFKSMKPLQGAGGKAPPPDAPKMKMGRPEDVSTVVLHLASDDASYINGQTICIDGGASMV